MWGAKVVAAADAAVAVDVAAAADAAETNWKHKVTPDRGDFNKHTTYTFLPWLDSKQWLMIHTCDFCRIYMSVIVLSPTKCYDVVNERMGMSYVSAVELS